MNDFIVMYLDSMKMNNTSHLDKVLLKENTRKRAQVTKTIYAFIITNILDLKPEQCKDFVKESTLEKLNFTKYMKNVDFPKGLPKDLYPDYLAQISFPEYKMSFDWIIDVYKKRLFGEIKSLPVGFFSDDLKNEKASMCLITAIKEKLFDYSPLELYEFFANSKKALKFLNEAGLSAACRNLYGDDALLYLHFSLGDQKKGTYYDALKITEEYNNMYRKEPANV